MSSRRILIVAYVFPPIGYAGTHRTLRLCRRLVALGYDVTVLTIKKQQDIDNDMNLVAEIPSEVFIVRTATIDPWRWYQRVKGRVSSLPFGRYVSKLIGGAIQLLTLPDHMVLWIPFALTTGLKLVDSKGIELIYVSSPPHSSQLVGWLLKRLTKKKWVADLRDPVLDNMVSLEVSRLRNRINSWLETKILSHADKIIANTKMAKERMVRRFPSAPVEFIYNGYDSDEFSDLMQRKAEKFTIAHVGSLYSNRKPDLVLQSVRLLVNRGLVDFKDFQLIFMGFIDFDLQAETKRLGLEYFVRVIGMTQHQEALTMMKQSHLLLLIKGMDPKANGQIPGKLFEYLATDNPILCIAPEQSEAAQLIDEANAGKSFDSDPEKIAEFILHHYHAFRLGAQCGHQDLTIKRDRERFSCERMADSFDAVFSEVLRGSASEDEQRIMK